MVAAVNQPGHSLEQQYQIGQLPHGPRRDERLWFLHHRCQCTFTYEGPNLPGADLIRGCADNNANATADTGEPCGQATKAWTVPVATPGQATGGGQIFNLGATDLIAFGFATKSDNGAVKGECTLVDPSTSTKIKCTDATVLAIVGAGSPERA